MVAIFCIRQPFALSWSRPLCCHFCRCVMLFPRGVRVSEICICPIEQIQQRPADGVGLFELLARCVSLFGLTLFICHSFSPMPLWVCFVLLFPKFNCFYFPIIFLTLSPLLTGSMALCNECYQPTFVHCMVWLVWMHCTEWTPHATLLVWICHWWLRHTGVTYYLV